MKTFARTYLRRLALVSAFAAAGTVPTGAAVTTLPAPTVVVYPFTISGNTNPEASGRLALLFATRLANAGGLNVKPPPPGIDRSRFLESAKAQGADYYVTGYVTPLGDSVSLLDQVVSTYSGIVVWSNTTEVQTYAEASGQADLIRDAILRHAGRTLAALDQPAPLPASTPAPSASTKPEQGNLSGLSGLFRRKPKPTPAPRPQTAPTASVAAAASASSPVARPLATPRPAATHPPMPPPPPVLVGNAKQTVFTEPGRSAIVVAVTGNAGETDRSYASTALASAVAKAGMGGLLVPSRTTGDAATMAKELCSAHRAGAIFGGMLSMQQVGAALTRAAEATFELVRYDCNGNVTTREQAQAKAMGRTRNTAAIDRAVEKSLDAALHPKTKRM